MLLDLAELLSRDTQLLLAWRGRRHGVILFQVLIRWLHDSRLLALGVEVVDDERARLAVFAIDHGPPADSLAANGQLDVLTRDRTWRLRRENIWLVALACFDLHVLKLATERALARRLVCRVQSRCLVLLC